MLTTKKLLLLSFYVLLCEHIHIYTKRCVSFESLSCFQVLYNRVKASHGAKAIIRILHCFNEQIYFLSYPYRIKLQSADVLRIGAIFRL